MESPSEPFYVHWTRTVLYMDERFMMKKATQRLVLKEVGRDGRMHFTTREDIRGGPPNFTGYNDSKADQQSIVYPQDFPICIVSNSRRARGIHYVIYKPDHPEDGDTRYSFETGADLEGDTDIQPLRDIG